MHTDKFNFYDQDDSAASYDAQSTLLWWRGSPYTKTDLEVPNPHVWIIACDYNDFKIFTLLYLFLA